MAKKNEEKIGESGAASVILGIVIIGAVAYFAAPVLIDVLANEFWPKVLGSTCNK